ncbi:MAG: L-ribulose-5-phosphate 4-epimerase [Candidatus Latescibacteria bacterium]|nr:L-ribulose-5-phosphate 4-epimerase [Candidatus Latescibacterota bacterium]
MKELKERVWETNMELTRRNLVIYTFGNASAIDRERGVFAIKPSGIPYEMLSPDNMVVVDLDNNIVEGDYNPSSDTRTHMVLYRHFSPIGGIVHTHSPYATAWAQAQRPIPCLGTTHADHLPGEIPCTEVMNDEQIRRDYEEETGNQIIRCFKNLSPEEIEMVLVASHGPFTWGATPEKAVYNSVMLEELAKMATLTVSINPSIQPLKEALLEKHYTRKHGKNATYGQKK